MQANPGGEIDPKDVVGRDDLIRDLWKILHNQSVIVVAERRMGKSSIVKKMRAECQPNAILIYRDVENVQTPLEFAERVCQDIREHLPAAKRASGFFSEMLAKLGGAEIGGIIKFPDQAAKEWKLILERAVSDLAGHLGDKVGIFVWDELPLLLQKIADGSGDKTAMDVLDTLRGLRQTHKSIRMIFTGSVGLHHVATGLRDSGHMNDATNDMYVFEIPELTNAHAAELGGKLLAGEKLRADDSAATVDALVIQTNAIPFYIHHVIVALRAQGTNPSATLVAQIVDEALVSPHDPWHLHHFRQRLTNYYGQDRLPIVLKVLDEVASAEAPVSFQHILQRIKGSTKPGVSNFADRVIGGDDEALRTLLQLLQRDHYLQQQKDTGRLLFRFPIIQRWWRLHRNLMP